MLLTDQTQMCEWFISSAEANGFAFFMHFTYTSLVFSPCDDNHVHTSSNAASGHSHYHCLPW